MENCAHTTSKFTFFLNSDRTQQLCEACAKDALFAVLKRKGTVTAALNGRAIKVTCYSFGTPTDDLVTKDLSLVSE